MLVPSPILPHPRFSAYIFSGKLVCLSEDLSSFYSSCSWCFSRFAGALPNFGFSQVPSLHVLLSMSFLRFIFFLDVVSLDLPAPSIIAVERAACHRVTRLAEMLWWPCIFKPAFCMLHLCLVKSKKHLGFCCFGLLKKDVQPP